MATANLPSAQASELRREPAGTGADLSVSEKSLVPSFQAHEDEDSTQLSSPVAGLPIELDVSVPIRDFRVRNLLALEPGRVIESQWTHGEDVPLASGHVQLAWSEFEVVDSRLAARITRLA